MTTVALSTGLRRGELLGLRCQDIEMLERLIHVRQQFVRNEISTPKRRAGRRTLPLGEVAAKALEEQFASSRNRAPESIVSRIRPRDAARPFEADGLLTKAIKGAGITKPFRPWHGLGNGAHRDGRGGRPAMFVQAKAGTRRARRRSDTSRRKRAIPMAELAEARLFNTLEES